MGLKEKIFDKTKETARDTAKKISEEIKDPKHLGEHTFETVHQEIISLSQTKSMFRDKKWHKRSRNIRATILNKISKNQTRYQPLILFLNQVEEQR